MGTLGAVNWEHVNVFILRGFLHQLLPLFFELELCTLLAVYKEDGQKPCITYVPERYRLVLSISVEALCLSMLIPQPTIV